MNRTICIAPMMECTDRHDRYFLRLISQRCHLYTEMLTTKALLSGDPAYLLQYNEKEHSIALQLGGNDPQELAQCTQLASEFGYDEVNLNVGCPSPRVQKATFGATLMAQPQHVARCISKMRAVSDIAVTVKTRIGIDHDDSYDFLHNFIKIVADAGCDVFIIHARKAWLQGLSPKQNREIPPLCYERVYRLKQDFPDLEIIINGGIKALDDVDRHLRHVDGVMLGREAYANPYLLATVDRRYYQDDHPILSRMAVLQHFLPYVDEQLCQGIKLSAISRHILGLFQGLRGARAWRRFISEYGRGDDADTEVLIQAAQLLQHAET